MRVYIAEQGLYENRFVAGIFDTPERAMAACGDGPWTKTTWTSHPQWPDRTEVRHWITWANDLDWDDAIQISEAKLIETGPERNADRVIVQTYRESDGGWDYLPEVPR